MTSLSWGEVLAKILMIGKYSGGNILDDEVDNSIFYPDYFIICFNYSGLLIII